jgi:outer membrane beta-barrel protein
MRAAPSYCSSARLPRLARRAPPQSALQVRPDIAAALTVATVLLALAGPAQAETPDPGAAPSGAGPATSLPKPSAGIPPEAAAKGGDSDLPGGATLYEGRRPDRLDLPNCLDSSIADALGARLRRRGVQQKLFLKKHRFEITGRGGLYASDLLSSSYVYGGALTYYLWEDFGVEASFDVTRVELDLEKPLEGFFNEDRFKPSNAYIVLGNFVWSPIHAKMKIGDGIVASDIVASAGVGRTINDTVQGMTFAAGLGWKLYLTDWFTLRLDLSDHVILQEALAEQKVANDIVATLGVSLWVPFGF